MRTIVSKQHSALCRLITTCIVRSLAVSDSVCFDVYAYFLGQGLDQRSMCTYVHVYKAYVIHTSTLEQELHCMLVDVRVYPYVST
jgi:hypothetical protein